MRIRKRFPLSSLASSVSLSVVSDPQLNHSPLVQPTTSQLHPIRNKRVQEANTDSQPSDPPNQPLLPLSSDQPPIIVVGDNLNNTSHKFEIREKEVEQIKLEESSREEEGNGGNNTRKQNIFLAAVPATETGVLTPISTSHQVDERWFDGDKKIPLKKRKGPIVEKTSQETLMLEKEKKMKPKMKSKTNKKCSTTMVHHNHGEQDKAGNDDNNSTNINVKKINKRGGAIMEGSRCSRVNGRGWRCCQQTLVGYSLCEHHLGKGRLRSITSVKGRAKVPTVAPTTIAPHNDNTTNNVDHVFLSSSMVQPARVYKETILLDGSCYDDHEDEDEEEDDDDYNDQDMKKPLFVKKKRMKLGVVKARSLSSLLNQTNNEVVVAADDN